MKLPKSFYVRDDILQVSRELLGKVLATNIDGCVTKAIITETEAYAGETDKASHAYGGRRTKRTEPIYKSGGRAYIYLCYGIHHMFNVVTNIEGIPHVALVRAGLPQHGAAEMVKRRGKAKADKTLLAGPGSLGKALGINTALTGIDLAGDQIWIEDHGIGVDDATIIVGPRVGIDYAEEDAELPYRFILPEAG
jgi:DNA-3-methyladenine glycosylase